MPDLGPMPTEKPPAAYAARRKVFPRRKPTGLQLIGGWSMAMNSSMRWSPKASPVRQISRSPKRACAKRTRPRNKPAPACGPRSLARARVSETRASLNQGFPQQFQSFLPHGWHDGGQVTGDLSYDLDLFGKNRAAFAAATSEADAARIDLAASRLSLSSAIAIGLRQSGAADGGSRCRGGRHQCAQAKRRPAQPAPGAATGKYRHGVGGPIAHPCGGSRSRPYRRSDRTCPQSAGGA